MHKASACSGEAGPALSSGSLESPERDKHMNGPLGNRVSNKSYHGVGVTELTEVEEAKLTLTEVEGASGDEWTCWGRRVLEEYLGEKAAWLRGWWNAMAPQVGILGYGSSMEGGGRGGRGHERRQRARESRHEAREITISLRGHAKECALDVRVMSGL